MGCNNEDWAVFWCALLSPLQLGEILLLHEAFDELAARHLLPLDQAFNQLVPAQQFDYLLQAVLDAGTILFGFSHGAFSRVTLFVADRDSMKFSVTRIARRPTLIRAPHCR